MATKRKDKPERFREKTVLINLAGRTARRKEDLFTQEL